MRIGLRVAKVLVPIALIGAVIMAVALFGALSGYKAAQANTEGCGGTTEPVSTGGPTGPPSSRVYPAPPPAHLTASMTLAQRYDALTPTYKMAARLFGLGSQGWAYLAGINDVETKFGTNMAVSSAGAVGWMQFEPSTFKLYKVQLQGHGAPDPYNPYDAIYAAANMLHADGAPNDWHRAIFAYNHSEGYVQQVKSYAQSFLGGGKPSGGSGTTGGGTTLPVASGGECVVTGGSGDGISQLAASQLGVKEKPMGSNCTKYGPCEEWCSLFVAWVWQHAGVPMSGGTAPYGYSGSLYTWAAQHHGRDLPPTATPAPGDAVFYGSGPGNSAHVGIVEQVFKNGEIVTIEGNDRDQVLRNGPFKPAQAVKAGEPAPIYGYAQPPTTSGGGASA